MTDTTSVLVTGGAGFIGCAASAELADRFDRVVVLDNLHPQIHATQERPAALDERAELVVGDVTDPEAVRAVVADARPDVVIHLAAETGTGQSLTESTRHGMVNVVGTTVLLDALSASDKRPRRIVLSSSRAVYGEGAWRRTDGTVWYPGQRTPDMLAEGRWDFEDSEPTPMESGSVHPMPVSVYGTTKLAQEGILSAWAPAFDVEPVILRLQNVYGPGQSLINSYTGIMSLFCRLAREGTSIPLYEDGEVRRDFILIDDVARAIVAAATAEAPGRDPIDIGSGEMQTIRTAAEIISRLYGAPEPHVTGQWRAGDVRHAWADVTRAADRLGWTPQFSLQQGLEQLVTWIEGQLPARTSR